ncbi:porin [Pseudomonas aeruginosa]
MIRRHSCKGVGSSVAWSLLGLAISAQSLAGTVTTDGADIVIKTKGGLEVATTDKEFSFKLGGRLQADYGRFDGYYTNNGNTADAAYFRRAYLGVRRHRLPGLEVPDQLRPVAQRRQRQRRLL